MNRTMLTREQIEQYECDGYLVLKDIVSAEILMRIQQRLEHLVDAYADEMLASGELSSDYSELPFDRRWAAIRTEVPAARPVVWRRNLIGKALYDLWAEPGILGAACSILGDEIRAYDLFNGRPREPHDARQTIGWHQDVSNCPAWDEVDSRILTFWIPLVPVDEETGCLAVVPGSHRLGRLPFFTNEFGITGLAKEEEAATDDAITVPLEPGDALMFNELMLHRSLDNLSTRVRWSVDIRFSADSPAHRKKAPGGFRVCGADGPEPFDEWVAKWNAQTGVMRRQIRRLDLYAKSLDAAEARDVRAY